MNTSHTHQISGAQSRIQGARLTLLALVVLFLFACSETTAEKNPDPGTAAKLDAAVAQASGEDTTKTDSDKKETEMTDSATDSAKSGAATEEKESAVSYESPIRDKKNSIVKLSTNHGDMILELYRDVAPNHADSFLARAEEGFYDSLIFHRVMKGFMIQGGDPTGTGAGDPKRPGYNLDQEFSKLPHKRGALSMARRPSGGPDDRQGHNTASAQFFICHVDRPDLDFKYTIFGQLLSGYETLDKIAATKVARANRPVEEVKILKITKVN